MLHSHFLSKALQVIHPFGKINRIYKNSNALCLHSSLLSTQILLSLCNWSLLAAPCIPLSHSCSLHKSNYTTTTGKCYEEFHYQEIKKKDQSIKKPDGSKIRGLRKLVLHEIRSSVQFYDLNLVLYSSGKRYTFTSCYFAHSKQFSVKTQVTESQLQRDK